MTEDAVRGLDRPLTAGDVDYLYQLVLGRAPESEAVRDGWLKLDRSVAALLIDLLNSAEFRTEVVERLRFDRSLGGRFEAPLGATATQWVREAFGEQAGAARGWLQLLFSLHARGVLRELIDGAGFAATASVLEKLETQPAGDAAVIATVEHFDGERFEGWAVDLADPDRTLRLDVWIDGGFARTLTTDRFRRDLQDRYGGLGRVGFDASVALTADPGRELRRFELRTPGGRTIARFEGAANGVERMDALAAVRAELERVRATLNRIEAALPDVRARAAFTIAAWDDYARVFYADAVAAVGSSTWEVSKIEARVRPGVGSGATLACALESLLAQTHSAWVARLAPDVLPERGRVDGLIADLADERIAWSQDDAPANDVVLVLYMSADDVLAPDALARFVAAHAEASRPGLIYADDDKLAPDGGIGGSDKRCEPWLKPPFDPYLLLQRDGIGAIHALDAGLVTQTPEILHAGSDHARLLAASRIAGRERVRHITRVLSHRGFDTQPSADVDAVRAHLVATNTAADVEPHADVVGPPLKGALRLRGRDLDTATASVIISTRDRLDLLRPCVESLLASRSANAASFDIVIVDNGGVDPLSAAYLKRLAQQSGVNVLRDEAPFNWAAINTRAALAATGEVLVFLNDDTKVVSPDWCDELVFWARQTQVGAVGGRLLYADGTIQHAGVTLGRHGSAIHEGLGEPGGSGGYLDRRKLVHATSAVTGACLATRAEVFRRLEGFDAARFGIAFNDMDYCLRLADAGLDCVYTPHATFLHYESQSRGLGDVDDRVGRAQAHEELALFRHRHAAALAQDPWVNAHFEPQAVAFTRLAPPPARP